MVIWLYGMMIKFLKAFLLSYTREASIDVVAIMAKVHYGLAAQLDWVCVVVWRSAQVFWSDRNASFPPKKYLFHFSLLFHCPSSQLLFCSLFYISLPRLLSSGISFPTSTYLSHVFTTKTLVLHFILIIHLALCHFPVIKLVPPLIISISGE